MVIHILDGSIFLMNISSESPMRFPHTYVKVKHRNNIDQSYVYVDNFWEKCRCLILIWQSKKQKNGKRTTSQLILKLPEIKVLSRIE